MKEKLSDLRKQVEDCKKCKLWEKRDTPVFGEGPENAELLLVGLGPGYHENLEGRPFVGAAGRLLNELLTLAGLRRSDVYITNVIKCYLPDNRATEEEQKACTPYLNRQIEVIKPTILVTLGNIATKYVFDKFGLPLTSMSDLHGKIFTVSTLQVKIIPMYHPAAALRNPGLSQMIKDDWNNLGKKLVSQNH